MAGSAVSTAVVARAREAGCVTGAAGGYVVGVKGKRAGERARGRGSRMGVCVGRVGDWGVRCFGDGWVPGYASVALLVVHRAVLMR